MSGFPNTPTRVAFGPEMENEFPPTNPKRDLEANSINLTFWQTAGAGRVLPKALIIYDLVADSILFQALAFDPRGELSNIAHTKNGTGDVTFTFASTYKDQNGNDANFTPKAATADVQSSTAGDNGNASVSAQTVNVLVFNVSAVAIDRTIIVQVW